MANITEVSQFTSAVYQIATTDPVVGGNDTAIANKQAKALADRTLYLKDQQAAIYQRMPSVVRNGVVSARYNTSTGLENLLTASGAVVTLNANSTDKFIASFFAGYDQYGEVVVNSQQTTSLTYTDSGTATRVVFVVRNPSTGVLTLAIVDAANVSVSAVEPTLVSEGFYYNYLTGRWWYYDTISWGTVQAIPLGSYSINTGTISNLVNFPYRRPFYDENVDSGTVVNSAASSPLIPFGTYVWGGWLVCDGSAVSRTSYARLFQRTSITFGVGDGSTTFNIPDLRGEFVRGFDGARGVDAGRAFGSNQASTKINGHLQDNSGQLAATVQSSDSTDTYSTTGQTSTTTGSSITHTRNGVRPRNVALYYLIKI